MIEQTTTTDYDNDYDGDSDEERNMIPFQKQRMDLWSSKDAQAYLKKNDLVILPVGCFEMHGPDIPLGCDRFIDEAMSLLLAEQWKCPCLPPVPYVYPGASGPWPGTVDISTDISIKYITAIVQSLIGQGFKRVALVGSHGPLERMLGIVAADFFQRTGDVVAHVRPFGALDAKAQEMGLPFREEGMVLGALHILGLDGVYTPGTRREKPIEFPNRNIGPLKKYGTNVPWLFAHDYQHTGLSPKLKKSHAPKMAEVFRAVAKDFRDMPKYFKRYQADMAKLHKEKPWDKAAVWTKKK